MFKYICKRIVIMPIILIAASVLIFLMINLTPYDPATQLLPADYTQEQLADLHAELGLDKPLLVQYGNWLIKAVQGDFGTSWQNRAPVWNDFGPRIPKSLTIAGLTILITMLIGLPLGILCAVKQYSFLDNLVNTLCKFLASFPQFMVGLILMYIFAVRMRVLPSMGFSSWKHAVLPVVTLCLTEIATYVRITRSSVLDCIRQDYVRTARSKGATERVVIWRDVLKNAMLPLITMTGTEFAKLIGGAVVIENVFSIPGVGSKVVQAINTKDIPTMMVCIVFLAALFVILTLVMDIVYTIVDPRLKSVLIKPSKKRLEGAKPAKEEA